MQIKVDIPRWLGKLRGMEAYNSKRLSAYLIFTRDEEVILTDGWSLFYLTQKDIPEILQKGEECRNTEKREEYARAYVLQKVPKEAWKTKFWFIDWEKDELLYDFANVKARMTKTRDIPNIWRVFWDITEGKQALLGINAWTEEHREMGVIKKSPLAGILAIDNTGNIEEATQGLVGLPMLVKLLPAMWKEGYYLGFAWYKVNHNPVIVELLRDEGKRAGWILVMPRKGGDRR